jgi:hypothetical protein
MRMQRSRVFDRVLVRRNECQSTASEDESLSTMHDWRTKGTSDYMMSLLERISSHGRREQIIKQALASKSMTFIYIANNARLFVRPQCEKIECSANVFSRAA